MNSSTKRHFKNKNKNKNGSKTKKNHKKYSIHKLIKKSFIFASKSVNGQDLLDYTTKNEHLMKNPCILNNINWFGNYQVAKQYLTHENHLYKWILKKNASLLITNKHNYSFFRSLFLNNKEIKLSCSLELTIEKINKIFKKKDIDHPYLNMNQNERAFYEFCFVFGYISMEEQYQFLKLIKKLLKKNLVEMKTRDGKSILKKIFIKMYYYQVSHFFYPKKENNRLSFYDLDKHAILNVCKLVKSRNLPIAGIFQEDNGSFWFPDLIFYKMNIEEIILFQPHQYLIFDKMVE